MNVCDYCGNEIDTIEHKCKFCGQIHCSKHLLPESHECIGLEQYQERARERWNFSNIKYKSNHKHKRPIIKTKGYFLYWIGNVQDWLLRRKHYKYNTRRIKYVLKIIFWFVFSLIALCLCYNNATKLNSYKLWIIRLAGVFLLISLFFVIKFGWRIIKEGANFIKRQKNWIKLLGVILLLILIWQAYDNRESVTNSISKSYHNINFNLFIPLSTSNSPINNQETEQNKTEFKFSNFIEGVIDPKSQIDIPDLELEVHRLINIERQKYGLSSLSYDSRLAEIARKHSEDMVENDFFDHTNLKGQDPTDRANTVGYSCHKDYGDYYTYGIAENIAETPIYSNVEGCGSTTSLNSLASCIVEGWMNSPGHRKNILTSEYDKEGIGIAYSSTDEAYTTENFC